VVFAWNGRLPRDFGPSRPVDFWIFSASDETGRVRIGRREHHYLVFCRQFTLVQKCTVCVVTFAARPRVCCRAAADPRAGRRFGAAASSCGPDAIVLCFSVGRSFFIVEEIIIIPLCEIEQLCGS
jgi:hypothetical protein